eukprot:5476612-Ditylum_brightwellii.AAC.1
MQALKYSWHKYNMTQVYGADCFGLHAGDGEPYIVDKAELSENKVRLIDASGKDTHWSTSVWCKSNGYPKT